MGDHPTFDATVRVAALTVEQAKEWVQKLNLSSGVTWRVEVTRPRLGKRVLFKVLCSHVRTIYFSASCFIRLDIYISLASLH